MKTRLLFLLRVFLLLGLIYASYLLSGLSLPYLALKPNVEFLLTKQLIYHISHWRWSFYIHVFTSILIVISGLTQFSRYILIKTPKLHRVMGSIYLIDVLLVSGPTALIMSFYANGSYPAQTSFVLLSICWLLSTFYSYLLVRKKEYERHGNWMLRSYALTLSAVTLRLYAYLFDVFRIEMHPVDTYILLAWLSWVPNLILAEILIRFGFIKRLLNRS